MTTEEIFIRKAGPEDLDDVRRTGIETFYDTFASVNTEADMQHYLSRNFSPEQVAAELNNPGSSFYLASAGGHLIGYLKINDGAAQTELQDDTALEIERIYVKREWHGKKAGQLLYETAVAIARERRKAFIWLGVWEKNQKAIRFYEKNGFVAFDTHLFRLGDDIQTDIMMKKTL